MTASATVHVLALNVGSSSLKYELALVTKGHVVARPLSGEIARFGPRAEVIESSAGAANARLKVRRGSLGTLEDTVVFAIDRARATATELRKPIDCVAHRIVHGGTRFTVPTKLGKRELLQLDELSPCAPLHQPAALRAVRTAMRALTPRTPHIGVFDTAFHATLPEAAWRYPIDKALADRHGIRKFGFHGLAFESVMRQLPDLIGKPRRRIAAVLLHLGSGCSAAAVKNGECIDTTMGLTPLEGLMMRTRCGDIDPAVPLHLSSAAGLSRSEVMKLLWRRSGLSGIAGGEGDMRTLLTRERTDPSARLALEMFVLRAKKQLGAYLALLGRADAIVFSGGVGEHAVTIRHRIVRGIETKARVLVVKSNEGDVIAVLAANTLTRR